MGMLGNIPTIDDIKTRRNTEKLKTLLGNKSWVSGVSYVIAVKTDYIVV
mgnify:CR=1 FL=1|jgi:hypothetical protein